MTSLWFIDLIIVLSTTSVIKNALVTAELSLTSKSNICPQNRILATKSNVFSAAKANFDKNINYLPYVICLYYLILIKKIKIYKIIKLKHYFVGPNIALNGLSRYKLISIFSYLILGLGKSVSIASATNKITVFFNIFFWLNHR